MLFLVDSSFKQTVWQTWQASWWSSHLILNNFGSPGSCVEDLVVLEFWQGFQAKYHDAEKKDEEYLKRQSNGNKFTQKVIITWVK
jgi:hypothetical protein